MKIKELREELVFLTDEQFQRLLEKFSGESIYFPALNRGREKRDWDIKRDISAGVKLCEIAKKYTLSYRQTLNISKKIKGGM